MDIRLADLEDSRVIDLLNHHATTARAQTARGSAHALDLTGFAATDIQLWTIWDGDTLAGLGALRQLDDQIGEIKSMHVRHEMRGRGAGDAMLAHLVRSAEALGLKQVSLETGAWAYFDPARRLYERHGFRSCPPFGDYAPDPNSVFMTFELGAAR